MAIAQGWSQAKGAGKWNLHICPLPHILGSDLPAQLDYSAFVCCRVGAGEQFPRAALPAMCPRLIRGHRRLMISFLSVLGLHFLNHLALSFVFSDFNNSTSSKGQDRCFPS